MARSVSGFESALSLFVGALGLLTAPSGFGIAVWILAIILAWSGIAKLRRPTLAAVAIVDFGVVRRVRPPLGAALGAGELLLALLLATGILSAVVLALYGRPVLAIYGAHREEPHRRRRLRLLLFR